MSRNLLAKTDRARVRQLQGVILVSLLVASMLALNPVNRAFALSTFPKLTQQGYIWENDDQTSGTTIDSNTPEAAGNGAISNVATGERLTLRTQLTNSGTALSSSSQLGLFYDRNDGLWSKVRATAPTVTGAGNCTDTNFSCSLVDAAYQLNGQSSIAVDSNGNPWIAYQGTTNQLNVAHYVATGGNCGTNNAWQCTSLDGPSGGSTDTVAKWVTIGISGGTDVWVAYYDIGGLGLSVAHYVGSGGTGCMVSSWTCGMMDWSADMGNQGVGLAFDSSGKPMISYWNKTAKDLYIAQYVGTGGTGCDASGAWSTVWSAAFTCTDLDATNNVGQQSAIAVDSAGNAWISYFDVTNSRLRVARYVGAGGTGCKTGVTTWTCEAVDSSGGFTSIAFDPQGRAWVSYWDTANDKLRAAYYTGGSGSGCVSSTNWSCQTVDNEAGTGKYTSIAFDPSGAAWITYQDYWDEQLKLARQVPSGGTGCTSGTTWTCTYVDASTSSQVGAFGSLAFGPDGEPWISYADTANADLRVAQLNRGGEIVPTLGSGANLTSVSPSLAVSHSDMSTVSDSANKTDADCLAASTTFNTGKWTDNENITGLTGLPNGSVTKQCTEVAYMISTAQAQVGTTYRFVIAVDDGIAPGRQLWRGPISVAQYPTLSTVTTTARIGKDGLTTGSQTCTDSSFVCVTIANSSDYGTASSLAFDGHGAAWLAFTDEGNQQIMWGKRVGTGGSGCAATMTTWSCGVLDSGTNHDYSGNLLSPVSIQVDSGGYPWVTYYDIGATYLDLRVAHYVGTGGTGCAAGNTAWTCVTVDSTGDVGMYPSLQLDFENRPWVSYYDNTNKALKVAHYVGTGGTGCALTTWTCTTVNSTNDSGSYSSMAMDSTGAPWIAFRMNTGTKLMVAHFVGSGGSGCSSNGWTCDSVDTNGNSGLYTAITFDGTGKAFVAYQDVTAKTQKIAKYVGTGGGSAAGCGASSSTAWSCQMINNSSTEVGRFTAMATDSLGNPWLAYKDHTNNRRLYARYVGTGGTGCTAGVTDWTCSTLASETTYGGWGDIAFDASGLPWISTYMISTGDIIVTKMIMAPNPPAQVTTPAPQVPGGHNARRGDSKFLLDSGASPRGSCAARSGFRGYCGVQTDDTDYDSYTAGTYERPTYTLALPGGANTSYPSVKWLGQTDFSNTFTLQVYRFGSTNAWVTLTTQSSPTINTQYSLIGKPSTGATSDYWKSDGTKYWAYYRMYQNGSTGTPASFTLKTNYFGPTQPPNSPASLAQVNTGGGSIGLNKWTNETDVKFTANVSDQDSADNDALCVEVKPIDTAFTNTEDACGSFVPYTSPTAAAASVTISNLTHGTQYHWQARVKDLNNMYSGWSPYGGNSDVITAQPDFGVDLVAPTGGIVYDGTSIGTESKYNNGTLTTLSANWSGFTDDYSTVASYMYAVGTTPGATDVLNWTANAGTSVTNALLTLRTSQPYYVSVRAYDGAGNLGGVVTSPGQYVAPTLTFSASSAVTFAELSPGNGYNDTKTANISVSTNGYYGYQVTQYVNNAATYSSASIPMYSSPWSAPTSWSGNGFGYTSNDTSVVGSNRFGGATKYAGLKLGGPGDVVADNSASAVSGDNYTLTYQVQVSTTQPAGRYRATILLSCVPTY